MLLPCAAKRPTGSGYRENISCIYYLSCGIITSAKECDKESTVFTQKRTPGERYLSGGSLCAYLPLL